MMFSTRAGIPNDFDAILGLLPRLADYELPPRRTGPMFWSSDAELVREWAAGNTTDCYIRVALDEDHQVKATGIITIGPDKFSGEPCAHLEVIVVSPDADGNGLGRLLMVELEKEARVHGASIMSLHVVGNNKRARHVYRGLGFDEEMIRAVKFLD